MRTVPAAILFALAVVAPQSRGGDVLPLLEKYCIDCHDSETQKGKVNLEGVAKFGDASPELWSTVREKLQLREMPPEKKPQPSAEERAELSAWIADQLRAGGHHVSDKLDWPNYGNYVDHESLFRGDAHPAPATGVRIWRRRPEAYAHKSGSGSIQPFSMLPGQHISDFSALYLVDESAAEIVLRNAQKLVESTTQFEFKAGKWEKLEGTRSEGVYLPLIDESREPSDEDFAKALRTPFARALDRAPTGEELGRLRALYDAVLEKYDRLHALRAVVTAPLLMPESLYRLELGAGELDEHGRRRMGKAEILAALHHTLFDKHPHRALHEARGKSELATREEVAVLVGELLDGDRPNGRVLNFFDEYFDYRKAKEVFKEPPRGLPYNAPQFVQDARRLIETIVAEDRDVFRRLLTTTQTYIAPDNDPPGNERIYGLPGDWKWREGLIELPPEQRAGILTHPAWLVAHSGNFDNDPVRRGEWVRQRLLGGTIPDLPISVDAVVPDEEGKTLRERFAVIRDSKYCWKCHVKMNPLGMPFEAYDHFGRFRLKELGQPVDTSGALTGTGDAAADGEVEDAVTMIRRIADTDRARQVFVRYAFRYFLGRNETLRDAQTLREADQAYLESDGSFKALVVSLLSSDSFLYRAPEL